MTDVVEVPARFTKYTPRGEWLEEKVTDGVVRLEVRRDSMGNRWLAFERGPQSICIEGSRTVQILSEKGWMAQYGTPPVRHNGRWGGRNYDQIEVPPESVRIALEALAAQGNQA